MKFKNAFRTRLKKLAAISTVAIFTLTTLGSLTTYGNDYTNVENTDEFEVFIPQEDCGIDEDNSLFENHIDYDIADFDDDVVLSSEDIIYDEEYNEVSLASSGVSYISDLPIAFPGADGAGKFATGGRGAEIYHVTNLNDSGTGSFRDAVSKSNRIVVFDVGGTITLKSDVSVSSNVSIMGQTAPGGGGVTLKYGKLGMGGSNIIVRFISSRPGERKSDRDYDAWGGSNGSNSIIDHCSLGWANDEQYGLYSGCYNQTVQYTIIGPSNCVSYHSKGSHGFGAMFGEGRNSWHHNLLCHSKSRNFRGKTIGKNPMDFVNNVIYDWGNQTAYGTFGRLNYVNNYLKAGPSTKGSYRFIQDSSGSNLENFKFYLTGNKIANKDDSVRNPVSTNNWDGGFAFVGGSGHYLEAYYRSSHYFPILSNGIDVSMAQNPESADDAYQNVINYAGAGINKSSLPKIDAQVLEETRTGTGSLTGGRDFSTLDPSNSNDKAMLTDISTFGINYMDYDEYYPAPILKKEIIDSDNDGMPDDWEIARGLNPNDPSDANGKYIGGYYTNIELYCNDLTIDAFPEGTVTISPTLSELGDDYTKVLADMNAIKLSKSKITSPSDIDLPINGSNGSTIEWRSTSDDIVIENNQITIVNRPINNDSKVSIIAKVTNGNCSLDSYYTLTVLTTTTKWFASSSNNGAPAGTELMNNLTTLFAATQGTLTSKPTIDGKSYSSFISHPTDNGSYANGVGSGTCLKYTAPANGTLTAYAGDVSGKTFYIVPEGVDDYKTQYLAAREGSGGTVTLSGKVQAGKTYYIFVAGSKGRLIGVKFDEESYTPEPTATPVTDYIKWNFDNYSVGASFEDGDKITNSNGHSLTSSYKSGSGTKPTITKRSDNDNYIKYTYATAGQDGWAYTPDTAMDGEKIIFEFEFTKSDDAKDTVFMRVFDTEHANPNNTFTSSSDGRVFELKTGVDKNLVITDFFSEGSASASDNQKGVDIGIADFTYAKNTWYGVKLEYYKDEQSRNTIDVYTRNASSKTYTWRDTVYLGSGVSKSGFDVNSIKITPTKVQCLTRKEAGVSCGIDNLSFGIQSNSLVPTATPMPTATTEPTSPPTEAPTVFYSFSQNETVVSEFIDGEIICNINGEKIKSIDQYTALVAQYGSNGMLINCEQQILSKESIVNISPDLKADIIRIFVFNDMDTIEPIGSFGEIKRAK